MDLIALPTCLLNEFLSFSRNLSILRDLSRCSNSSGVNRSLMKCVNTFSIEQQLFLIEFRLRDIFPQLKLFHGVATAEPCEPSISLRNHITYCLLLGLLNAEIRIRRNSQTTVDCRHPTCVPL